MRANSPIQRCPALRFRYYWSCVAAVGDRELLQPPTRLENVIIVGNSNSIFLLPFVIIWFKNCRSAASGSLNVLKLFVCKLGYF